MMFFFHLFSIRPLFISSLALPFYRLFVYLFVRLLAWVYG